MKTVFKSASKLALLAALVVTVIPGRKTVSARPAGSAPKVRVGLVFDVGGRGDKSFNDAAYEGLTRAERELDGRLPSLLRSKF